MLNMIENEGGYVRKLNAEKTLKTAAESIINSSMPGTPLVFVMSREDQLDITLEYDDECKVKIEVDDITWQNALRAALIEAGNP